MSEVMKARVHLARQGGGYFVRDRKGFEVDLLLDIGARFIATEIRSGQTVAGDFFAHLEQLKGKLPRPQAERQIEARVVYGGSNQQRRREIDVIPWNQVKDLSWW